MNYASHTIQIVCDIAACKGWTHKGFAERLLAAIDQLELDGHLTPEMAEKLIEDLGTRTATILDLDTPED